MLLSKNWLAEFITFSKNLTDEEIALRLSLSTVEVEGIHKGAAGEWDHIVVGRIEELKAHPNADRLKIAMTRISERKAPVCIVCGGSNLKEGMSVIVALPGSRIHWHGQGELVSLEKTKIRGIESSGMICASSEVGLAERFPASDDREIVDLTFLGARPGTPLTDAFSSSDSIFDIDHKSLSNRPDLWGHRGMAREIAAVLSLPFQDKTPPAIQGASNIQLSIAIQDTELCKRYMAVAVQGVSPDPSPDWMQERLRSCGVRPINVIVDITNYVMLESGQPMHAFDYDRIKEKNGRISLIARRAKKEERIAALDGNIYSLSRDMLVIANTSGPLAIAGVMGGERSGISPSTTAIILESANFSGNSVRRTSSALKLFSESSRRFEKQQDAHQASYALQRAVELYMQLCPGSSVASTVCDMFPKKEKSVVFVLTKQQIESKLGISIPLSKAKDILSRLDFGVIQKSYSLRVTVPSFRSKDIIIPEDIIEEILRLHGYEHVPSKLPALELRMPTQNSLNFFIRKCKEILASTYRIHESHSYAFNAPAALKACGFSLEDHIRLSNPFSDERPYLCRSLIPNLLESVEKNQHGHKRIALFEIAPVFHGTDPDQQPCMLSCVFSDPAEKHLFSFMKSLLVSLCVGMGYVLDMQRSSTGVFWWKQGCAADLVGEGKTIGVLAIVDPQVTSRLGIDRDVVACELNLSLLHTLSRKSRMYAEQPMYPSVRRDINCVVDEAVSYESLYAALAHAHALVAAVEPFDLYRGPQAGDGKKSISFHVGYRSNERTLTSDEADKAHIEVAALLEKKFNATIR